MGNNDTTQGSTAITDEEDMFLQDVIAGDAELLYIDSFLQDTFRKS